jgi:hypothetical protein
MDLSQIGSLIGAALVLAAFVGHQTGRVDPRGRAYQLLNLVGAAVLVASALTASLWGFVALNLVWAAVSLWALARGL